MPQGAPLTPAVSTAPARVSSSQQQQLSGETSSVARHLRVRGQNGRTDGAQRRIAARARALAALDTPYTYTYTTTYISTRTVLWSAVVRALQD